MGHIRIVHEIKLAYQKIWAGILTLISIIEYLITTTILVSLYGGAAPDNFYKITKR